LKIFDIQVKGILSLVELVDSAQPQLAALLITGRIESGVQEESVIKLLEESKKRSLLLNSLNDEIEITIKTLY
jgi:DNA-binding TFAR19-related protein (PDSD5 family)